MKLPKLDRRERWTYYMFAMLGIFCVMNLNAIAGKFFGFDRFFSPFILLFCVLGVLRAGTKGITTKLGKFGLLLLIGYISYLSFGCLSAFIEKNQERMTGEVLRFGASVAVTAATILLVRRLIFAGHVDRVMKFVFWLSIASSATIFISYLFPQLNAAVGVADRAGRMSGFFANPNELATQTLITTAFGFGLASRTLNIKYLVITFLVCVPAVLGAHTRSAIVGMACMIFTLSCIVFPAKYVVRTTMSLAVVGLIGFGGMSYLQSLSEGSENRALQKRTDQLFEFMSGDVRGATTGGRFDLAKEAIGLWSKKPVIGHGLGYMNEMPIHRGGPHNMILKMMGDSGLSGSITLGLFWILFFFAALQCRIRWLKVTLLGTFMAISFNLISAHTGISRRFIVFQLAVIVAFIEPKTQRQIAQTLQGNTRKFVWFRAPDTPLPSPHMPHRAMHPPSPIQNRRQFDP